MSRIATPRLFLLAAIAGLLQGCATSITGIEGSSSSFSCKAPEGVQCDSVSGNYYNAIQNNLPSQRRAPPVDAPPQPAAPGAAGRTAPMMLSTAARTTSAGDGAAASAVPLRAAPRVLRLWIKSWEDADRDLVGESVVYVQVDNGRWLVDHVQREQRDAFAPVRAPKAPADAVRSSAAAGATPSGRIPDHAEDTRSITQAMRALQGRDQANQDQ